MPYGWAANLKDPLDAPGWIQRKMEELEREYRSRPRRMKDAVREKALLSSIRRAAAIREVEP